MNVLSIIILIFAIGGAIDLLFGNKLGIGKEFEKGFLLFAPMAFSMLGMLVIAPAIGVWLTPVFEWFYSVFNIDPSIIPASLLSTDMGGMTLAQTVCKSQSIGNFNAYIVASMTGCVVSFTIPFALGVVKREQHPQMFFGILCGIVAIPVGCFVAGLMCGIGITELLLTLLPLIIFSVILGTLLVLFPNACIKVFSVFGFLIRCIGFAGMICAIFTFLTKITIYEHFDSFENAAFVCVNACVTLSGALPLMFLISKLINKPFQKIGSKIGIDSTSTVAFLSTIVTNAPTFGMMDKMNKKGTVLNSAFAASAAFALGGHLALIAIFDSSYVAPMIVGKLVAGVCAVTLALIIYKDKEPNTAKEKEISEEIKVQ